MENGCSLSIKTVKLLESPLQKYIQGRIQDFFDRSGVIMLWGRFDKFMNLSELSRNFPGIGNIHSAKSETPLIVKISITFKCSTGNVFMQYANNKGAGQPAHPRSLISTFIVRCLHSIRSLVSISEISSLYLASVAAQTCLCLPWSQTPKTGYLMTRLKYRWISNKTVNICPNDYPWITCHIKSLKSLIHKRRRIYNKFKKTNTLHYWNKFKILRNIITNLIRRSKQEYSDKLENTLNNENPNSKLLWKISKQFLRLGKTSQSIPTLCLNNESA